MTDEDVDREALRRYVDWVDEGRVNPEVHETPIGTKFAADRSSSDAPEIGRAEVDSFRAALGSWEDVIVSIYEGDLGAVDEISEEWWEEFVLVADEALGDVGEEEMKAARE